MLKRRVILLLWTCVFFLTLMGGQSFALAQSFEEFFRQGVQEYQDKKYREASESFSKALKEKPDNVNTLTNLALAQFHLGQKGFSVALLRRAVSLEPDFSTPNAALAFITPQLEIKEIPHEIEFWESFRKDWLLPFSLNQLLALLALTFFAAGWLWIGFIAARKKANIEELAPPNPPWVATVSTLMMVLLITLVSLKLWDRSVLRGTVIAEKVTVFAAPDEKSTALFDLYAGLEVIVRNQREGWVQVTYPGGMTGWIVQDSFYQTTGEP